MRETLEPGVIVQSVADRHGVSTGQRYTWRKQMLATAMAGFAPVAVVPEAPKLEAPSATASQAAAEAPATIELALASGTTVRITGQVDAALLRAVLAELGGR